jgi:hypothetical protein
MAVQLSPTFSTISSVHSDEQGTHIDIKDWQTVNPNPFAPFNSVGNYNIYPSTVSPTVVGWRYRNVEPRYRLYPDLYSSNVSQSPLVRRQIARDLRYKFLDKWLWEESSYLLKYLKVKNGVATSIKNKDELKKNNVSKDNQNEIEVKADYIGDVILTESKAVKLLDLLSTESGVAYADLPHYQKLVRENFERYVEEKFGKRLRYGKE